MTLTLTDAMAKETLIVCAECGASLVLKSSEDGPLYKGIGEIRLDCPECGANYRVHKQWHSRGTDEGAD